MGFSFIAGGAIIGISLLMVLEIFTGGLLPAITDINDSYDEMKDRLVDQDQTSINITNVEVIGAGTPYDINFTVNNTGSITLETNDFNIMINGTSYPFTSSSSYIYPENQVNFTVSSLTETGNQKLKVITNNGKSDTYSYVVSF